MFEALARGVAPVPLRCPAVIRRAQHPRPDALEAAVQADPGLRNRVARMGGGTASDANHRHRGIRCGWDQNSLGVGPPLDVVPLDDVQQRFATGKKVQPQLAKAHAGTSVHLLGILNHPMGEHRPNRVSATPISILRVITIWYIMMSMLHSRQDQEATEVCVGESRGRSPLAPMDNGVHEAKGFEATGYRP